MRLERLAPDVIRKAVRIYLEEAWGGERVDEKWPEAVIGESVETILKRFEDEADRRGASGMRRYALRLGNSEYPHMKLIVQEVLIKGEFFLSVDTHDEMESRPSFPGHDEWCAVKDRNKVLREAIEERWRGEPEIPTCADLASKFQPAEPCLDGRRILVVDDDNDILGPVCALLESEGYCVHAAHDGEEALEAVASFDPELMIIDYQMPGLDGIEVCRRLRDDEATKRLPILLSTASLMDLSVFGRVASGFLLKPYDREWLLGFVTRHLP